MITLLALITLATFQTSAKHPVISATTAQGLPSEFQRRMIEAAKLTRRYYAPAEDLLARGKNAEAETLLAKALTIYPDLHSLEPLLGETLIRQGKDAEALQRLLGLRSIGGLSREGNEVRIALLQVRLGQTDASRAAWRPEIVTHYLDGMPEAAASLPAIDTSKGLETAWTLAAGYLTDLHSDDAGAAFYYGRALALDPTNAFVNLKMGDLELRRGEAASALARYALAAKGTGRLRETALRQGAIARAVAAKGGSAKSGGWTARRSP